MSHQFKSIDIEVVEDGEEIGIGIVGKDFMDIEHPVLGFSLDTAKELAHKILNLAYRIENGKPLPDGGIDIGDDPEERQ